MKSIDGVSRFIRPVLYQDVFRSLRFPLDSAIFTDMEYLTPLQLDAAIAMEGRILEHNPHARILNPPSAACERYQLLRKLEHVGISSVQATRLESGDHPGRYPVFIRSEVGCAGPETGLLEDREAFDAAVDQLVEQGRGIKGRVALSFEAQTNDDGYYRKYGAVRVGDRIIPQHLMRGQHWIIKRAGVEYGAEVIAEEWEFIVNNPHQSLLMEAFDAGNLQYGRADYGFKDGKLVIYEINVNPTLPQRINKTDSRTPRRNAVRTALSEAFRALDDGSRSTTYSWLPSMSDSHRLVEMRSWNEASKIAWRLRRHLAKRHYKSAASRSS